MTAETITKQQERLYQIEQGCMPTTATKTISAHEAEILASDVWARFAHEDAEFPMLNLGGVATCAWYDTEANSVTIPSDMMCALTVVHEIAHAILETDPDVVAQRSDILLRDNGHGPEFAGFSAHLYAQMFGLEIEQVAFAYEMHDVALDFSVAQWLLGDD